MKRLISLLLVFSVLLLVGCTKQSVPVEDGSLKITCTTYPVFLLCSKVVEGITDVDVSLLIDQDLSCVHDYSLSVNDMKKLDNCDIVLLNGAGFEFFLNDVDLSAKAVYDCSAGIELLCIDGHSHEHDHDHEHSEYDPHIWLDPENAAMMAVNIAEALSSHLSGEVLMANAESYGDTLMTLKAELNGKLENLSCRELITFHDGFAYFAEAFGLNALKSIEEESGSEASAAEMAEIISLIHEYNVPAVFTEVNGATATAEAIARETGVVVASLNMMMSAGDTASADPYCDIITANVESILEALG